jgi:S1-C subfamily serine protease
MEKVVRDALKRSVVIKTEHHTGTGVIIAENIVITVFHILESDSPLLVNGVKVKASSIYVDPESDLMLLSVPTDSLLPVELADSCEKDDPVFYVGNPVGHEGAVVRGRIVNILENTIYTDFHGGPGASGAGVYASDGKLVGIFEGLQLREKFGIIFTMCIPSETVLKVLTERQG